jgi:phage protein U
MYLQIGDLVLEGLLGFTNFQESGESYYPEHALIGALPVVQFTGRKLSEITGSLDLHSLNNNIPSVLTTFKDYQEDGTICPIIKGNGDVMGNFVIVNRRITHKQQDALGNIVSCTLDLTIKEHSQITKPTNPEASTTTFATSRDNAPLLIAPRKAAVAASQQATISLSATAASGNAISKLNDNLQADNTQARIVAESVRRKIATVAQSSAKIITIIDADPTSSIFAITRDLSNTTGQIISLCDLIDTTALNCINAVDASNTVGVLQCIDDIKNQTLDLNNLLAIQKTQSAPLTALASAR